VTKGYRYTHRGRVHRIQWGSEKSEYWAELRKVGKWWETKGTEGVSFSRRFDKLGNHKDYGFGVPGWRLDIDSITPIK